MQTNNHKIVDYAPAAKVVWQLTMEQPSHCRTEKIPCVPATVFSVQPTRTRLWMLSVVWKVSMISLRLYHLMRVRKRSIAFPSLKDQKDIVTVLSNIDCKIALNRQINDNLRVNPNKKRFHLAIFRYYNYFCSIKQRCYGYTKSFRHANFSSWCPLVSF